MNIARWPRPVLFGVAIAILVNLFLLVLYFWGQDGQTTLVEVRNEGGAFRAFTDGKQVVPGGKDKRDAAFLNVPERGTVILVVAPSVAVLPEPSGVDSILITDRDGEELFRDDFDELDPEDWDVLAGEFDVVDGVLTALSEETENSLILRREGWSEYDVAVTYRNSSAGVIGMNVTGEGRMFYHFDLVRDFPAYFTALNYGEKQPGAEGSLMRTDYVGPLKSTAQMLSQPLPFIVAAFVAGTLLVFAASFLAPATASRQRRLSATEGGGPASAHTMLALAGVVALLAAGVALYLNQTYYEAIPHLPDEVSYLFQAHLFANFQITGEMPPAHEAFRFYDPAFLYEREGRWASFYPFGHPLVLSIGAFIGAIDVVPVLVGAATIVLTFLIGRRLFDARTGLVAAVLFAASPFFLMQAGSYMSHNTGVLYLLLALFFILKRDRPVLYGVIAGLAFGLAVNTRLLTTIALTPVFGVFMLTYLLSRREDMRTWLSHTGPFVVTVLVMVGAMLLHNLAITGDPLTSPYTGTQGEASELFGFRDGHYLDIGLRNLQAQLMALLLVFNSWPTWAALALVLLPFMLGSREPKDYFLAACVLSPILLQMGYRYSGIYEGPRYWYETMPFMVLLSARGADLLTVRMTAVATWLRHRRWPAAGGSPVAAQLVVYVAVAALLVYGTGGWLFGWREDGEAPLVPTQATEMKGLFGVDGRLDALADEMDLENALVLVRPCGSFESAACYGSVFLRNLPDFGGDVVWALYDEELNPETIAAYPDREVFIATWEPEARIDPLEGE